MADPYLGEIRMFPFNFAPKGWAFCNGQTLSISQNTALFSLLGTNYGGDGKSTFGLPNLQASAALCFGQGNGLSQYQLGQTGGSATVTLNISQLGTHSHTAMAAPTPTNVNPGGLTWSGITGRGAPNSFANAIGTSQTMSTAALAQAGGGQPHNNLMPYLVINFCIALQGIFPARN